MKSVSAIVLITIVLLLTAPLAQAQSDKAKKLDEFITPFVKANQFYGQVVATENGRVIYDRAFGIANADFNIPNRLDTRIGIASITKYMTEVILLRLVETNKIALADKVSKYIPDFPSGDKITIEILMHHRSGIPHRVMPSVDESIGYTSAEFVERVKQAKLVFEPGSGNLYSSAGYAVLARCLELASGKSYEQLLQEFVFAPAGMTDSLTFDPELVMDRRAQDYYPSPEGLMNVPLKNYAFLVGAGSVYGNAEDVNKFAQAIMEGKYGEGVKTYFLGPNNFIGSGSTNGHRSYFEIEKDRKYGYVIVSNLAGAFDLIAKGIKEILQGQEPGIRSFTVPKIVPNPNKDMNEFLGRFKRDDGTETTMILRNGFIYSGDIKFYPTKPDCFFEYRFFGNVCFVRDPAGKIISARWAGQGFDLNWVKQ